MKFAPLEALEATSHGPEDAPLTVVLMHGFGAPGTDLVGLASALDLPTVRFVFPMAPLVLEPHAPPEYAARAWWLIDMMELQTLRMRGDFAALTEREPEGLVEAQSLLCGFLKKERESHPSTQLVLGGFSQGAMLAANTVFQTDESVDGLVLLSGTYISRSDWKKGMERRRGLRCFQSHSPDDVVLPVQIARMLGEDLDAAGLVRTSLEFRGGHGIPSSVLTSLRTFLQGLRG